MWLLNRRGCLWDLRAPQWHALFRVDSTVFSVWFSQWKHWGWKSRCNVSLVRFTMLNSKHTTTGQPCSFVFIPSIGNCPTLSNIQQSRRKLCEFRIWHLAQEMTSERETEKLSIVWSLWMLCVLQTPLNIQRRSMASNTYNYLNWKPPKNHQQARNLHLCI